MFSFEFSGGNRKCADLSRTLVTTKFHVFIVTDDKELHLFQAAKEGLVSKVNNLENGSVYTTRLSVVKVFMSHKQFGSNNFFQSYYIRLGRDYGQRIEVLPDLRTKPAHHHKQFFFKAPGKFLRMSEVEELLGSNSESFKYFKRQIVLPTNEMKKFVGVYPLEQPSTGGRIARLRVIR
jgi:hypothetical protein